MLPEQRLRPPHLAMTPRSSESSCQRFSLAPPPPPRRPPPATRPRERVGRVLLGTWYIVPCLHALRCLAEMAGKDTQVLALAPGGLLPRRCHGRGRAASTWRGARATPPPVGCMVARLLPAAPFCGALPACAGACVAGRQPLHFGACPRKLAGRRIRPAHSAHAARRCAARRCRSLLTALPRPPCRPSLSISTPLWWLGCCLPCSLLLPRCRHLDTANVALGNVTVPKKPIFWPLITFHKVPRHVRFLGLLFDCQYNFSASALS